MRKTLEFDLNDSEDVKKLFMMEQAEDYHNALRIIKRTLKSEYGMEGKMRLIHDLLYGMHSPVELLPELSVEEVYQFRNNLPGQP